ncbi:MAG: TetR family transcriptional regulator [Alphaproteobacteria bacterium PA2]|nr:MAG: TetR family transcriptional regulator [Alphaproteobacteria bacterium PA2]
MKTPTSSRDQTRERILDAAKRVLAETGYASFGVNAVAREAGCDKVLIYRYFGGLEGLAEAMGDSLSFWLPQGSPVTTGTSYAESMRSVLAGYLAALRQTPLVKRILSWELLETNELTTRLGAAKSISIRNWFQNLKARTDGPPPGIDAPAINAILIAAAHHLALREDNDGAFSGLDLRDPHTWTRLDTAFGQLIEAAYQPSPRHGDS